MRKKVTSTSVYENDDKLFRQRGRYTRANRIAQERVSKAPPSRTAQPLGTTNMRLTADKVRTAPFTVTQRHGITMNALQTVTADMLANDAALAAAVEKAKQAPVRRESRFFNDGDRFVVEGPEIIVEKDEKGNVAKDAAGQPIVHVVAKTSINRPLYAGTFLNDQRCQRYGNSFTPDGNVNAKARELADQCTNLVDFWTEMAKWLNGRVVTMKVAKHTEKGDDGYEHTIPNLPRYIQRRTGWMMVGVLEATVEE